MITDTIQLDKLTLKVSIGDNANAKVTLEAIDNVCAALQRQESSVERLRVLLGKLAAVVQDKKLYTPAHASFEAWSLDLAKRHRLSRATIRESLMIARKLPDLTPAQAEVIPITSLSAAARAVKPEMDAKSVNALLRQAAEMPAADFRKHLHDEGLLNGRKVPEGQTILRITTSDNIAKKWREFVGEDDPGKVLGQLLNLARAKAKGEQAQGMTRAAGGD